MSQSEAERRERFLAALASIEAATDLPDVKRAMDGLIEPYGLRHAVLFAVGRAGVADGRDTILFTYPTHWVERYIQSRYHAIDPVMRVGMRSIVPVDWATLDRSAPVVRRFFDEAGEAGVGRQGLALPSRGPGGAQALFNVTCDASDRDWAMLRHDLVRDMGIVASHLHAKLLEIGAAAPPGAAVPRLSVRERETLQWAAAGRTIDQTADILGLSSSAVRTYLDAARRKLNCLTKPQAVAVAMRRGLIEG